MKKIFGFLQGFTGALSGHLPGTRSRKKIVKPTRVGARHRSTPKTAAKKKQKTRRIRSGTARLGSKRDGRLRKDLKPIQAVTDNTNPNPSPAHTTIYTCPACSLQATEAAMVEHLLGSPLHRPRLVQPEQTIDHKDEGEQATVLREEDSRDSLRNLLQILLPPRAFGRRHGQKTLKI
jgi:hypothetical protein